MLPTNITEFVNFSKPLNTGPMTVPYELGPIYKFILIPHGKQFTATECLTLYSTLQAVIQNNSQALRGYPIGDFIDFSDKSTSEQTNTTGYGYLQFGNDGKHIWEFMWDQGGMSFEKVLKSFQNLQGVFDMLILDRDSNVVLGTKCPLNTGGYVLQGFQLGLIYSTLVKIANGKEKTKHSTVISLKDSDELVERHLAIQLDPVMYPLNNLVGLFNLELAMGTASGSPFTTTTVRIKVTTCDGHLDLYDTYGAALAALTWTAVTDATGATLTVSSVAVHPATKSLLVTFGSSTSAGASVTLSSPSVSAMAATVPGFANNSLTMVAV